MSKTKDKGTTNNSWLNFLDTITSIIIVPVLLLSIISSVIMLNAKRSNNVPNIFGYSLVTILSGSMTRSGFEKGDSVIVKSTEVDQIEVGDIIAYYKYIESVDTDLSQIARASYSDTYAITNDLVVDEYPAYSKISSWKLYLSKIFSNITYTSTEASQKAIKANSAIIFHQVVDVVEYDGYLWFKTWGTSNITNPNCEPVYDSYWIREDYIIGRYTHTSSAVRGFLSFASTNTGILWMVEVPSGIHLVLSTLELVEILDMMTRERHERIKHGTYIDKKEYRKLLRAKQRLLAAGNIDVDVFKQINAPYENYDIYFSQDDDKSNVNINGPPGLNGLADDDAWLHGEEGGKDTTKPDPGGGRASNGRDGPPDGTKPDPGGGRASNGRDGPPDGTKPDPGGGRASNGRDGPPDGTKPDPGGGRASNGRDGPPDGTKPDPGGGQASNGRDGPPGKEQDFDSGPQNAENSPDSHGQTNKIKFNVDKSVLKHSDLYDREEDLAKDKQEVQKLVSKKSKPINKKHLLNNQVVLSQKELDKMIDTYHADGLDFIADCEISSRGVITKPDKKNKIYLLDVKSGNKFSTESLGVIYSLNTGLITSSNGLFRCLLTSNGVEFEQIELSSACKLLSAKQDKFGNIYVGVVGGSNKEEQIETTSDGKRISIWNRNALLMLGDDNRLYYMSMKDNFDIHKGKIADVRVLNKNGKLESVGSKGTVQFIDGYDKYGFVYLSNNIVCLDKGKMFFDIESKATTVVKDNLFNLSDSSVAYYDKKSKKLHKMSTKEFLEHYDGKLKEVPKKAKTYEDVSLVTPNENKLLIECKDGKVELEISKLTGICFKPN